MATTYELIASTTLGSSATNIEFTSIPATYDDLVIVHSLRSDRSGSIRDLTIIRFNGAANDANMSCRYLRGDGSSASSASPSQGYAGWISGGTGTSNTFGSTEIYIPNYSGSTNKSYSAAGCEEGNYSSVIMEAIAGLWSQTTAISDIELLPLFGPNFVSGSSAYLYGITKA